MALAIHTRRVAAEPGGGAHDGAEVERCPRRSGTRPGCEQPRRVCAHLANLTRRARRSPSSRKCVTIVLATALRRWDRAPTDDQWFLPFRVEHESVDDRVMRAPCCERGGGPSAYAAQRSRRPPHAARRRCGVASDPGRRPGGHRVAAGSRSAAGRLTQDWPSSRAAAGAACARSRPRLRFCLTAD